MKNKPIIPDFSDPDWWWAGMPYVALRDIQDEYADKESLMAELEEGAKCKCEDSQKIVESKTEMIICVKCWKAL